MSPSPTAPGVYATQEVPAPAPQLRTAVPAFVGYASDGPVGVGDPLTLVTEFDAAYGAPVDGGFLSDAVHGFFANGGEICRVVRLNGLGDAMGRALTALETVDDVDLVCAPDLAASSDGSPADPADVT